MGHRRSRSSGVHLSAAAADDGSDDDDDTHFTGTQPSALVRHGSVVHRSSIVGSGGGGGGSGQHIPLPARPHFSDSDDSDSDNVQTRPKSNTVINYKAGGSRSLPFRAHDSSAATTLLTAPGSGPGVGKRSNRAGVPIVSASFFHTKLSKAAARDMDVDGIHIPSKAPEFGLSTLHARSLCLCLCLCPSTD